MNVSNNKLFSNLHDFYSNNKIEILNVINKSIFNESASKINQEAVQSIILSEKKPNKRSLCSVVPTLHGADTQDWRKRLIQAAKHNIVISGNYCGGKAFDEILKLVGQRMKKVPTLKVVIISHPKSVQDHQEHIYENKTLISELQQSYPDRFSYVESPDSYFGTKKITNHTKCTVIDYGKYFIQGSSGIKDAFNASGLDSENNEEEFLETKKIRQSSSLIDRIVAVNLREEDFVFSPTDENLEAGKKMYREALYLAYKWQQHEENTGWFGHYLSPKSWDLDDKEAEDFPVFSNDGLTESMVTVECDQKSALYQMLTETIPDMSSIATKESSFEESERKVDDVKVKLFFTGPENKVSRYEKQMVKRINNATNNIVIAHMYFHPSNNLMNALIAAAKRGVKITIVTAGITKHSPPGEKFFAPRNAYNYSYLIGSLSEKDKGNVSVYEFDQKNRGLHKKVMIVDNYVFSGSSNMGYKSLVLMGDHEMNFEAHSSDLVKQTMNVINEDIRCSTQVMKPENTNLRQRWQAGVHSIGARFWG